MPLGSVLSVCLNLISALISALILESPRMGSHAVADGMEADSTGHHGAERGAGTRMA